jgi:Ca2+-binding RTX toxin-like protein
LFGHADDGEGSCDKATATDDDTIHGGRGDDDLVGEYSQYIGTDKVYGDRGDDDLTSYGGREHFFGGAGKDLFDASLLGYPGGSLHLDLAAGTYTIGDNAGAVRGVENVTGTPDDDVIYGDEDANFFLGLEGADELHGRAGNDVLRGDFLRRETKAYADSAFGGRGTDECHAETAASCERP